MSPYLSLRIRTLSEVLAERDRAAEANRRDDRPPPPVAFWTSSTFARGQQKETAV